MDERVLYCADLDKDPGFPGCCNSCHDDSDMGYGDLIEKYDGDTLTHVVCCRVGNWLDVRGTDNGPAPR